MASLSSQISKLNSNYSRRLDSGRGDIDRRTYAVNRAISVRSNVIGGKIGGRSSFKDDSTIKIPNRSLDCWLRTMNELYAYEMFDLIQNIIKLVKDYLSELIDTTTTEYFTISEDPDLTIKLNEFILKSDVTRVFYDDIDSLVYYGGCGHHIKWGYNDKGEKSWVIVDLPDPHKILEVERLVTKDKVLVDNKTGSRKHIQVNEIESRYVVYTENDSVIVSVDPSQIMFFSTEGIRLEVDGDFIREVFKDASDNTPSSLKYNSQITSKGKLTLSDIIQSSGSATSVSGGKSIFYSLTSKIKEYVVKEALQSVLGTKDLLMPTLLKLGYDLNQATDTSELAKTINEIESKINDAVDMSMLAGDKLDVGAVLNSAFSTVRVIPDPNNLLSQLDLLNTQPVQDKFEKIKEEKTTVEDSIKDSLGIPSDLFDGGSNQYEVLTRSQRYETTISTMIKNLRDTYIANSYKLCELSSEFNEQELDLIKIAKCNVFRPSSIDITHRTTLITQQQELARALNDLVSTYSEMIRDNKLIVDAEALNSLKESLRYIDPKMISMVVEEPPVETEEQGGW